MHVNIVKDANHAKNADIITKNVLSAERMEDVNFAIIA